MVERLPALSYGRLSSRAIMFLSMSLPETRFVPVSGAIRWFKLIGFLVPEDCEAGIDCDCEVDADDGPPGLFLWGVGVLSGWGG